jgi:hypothetical protein
MRGTRWGRIFPANFNNGGKLRKIQLGTASAKYLACRRMVRPVGLGRLQMTATTTLTQRAFASVSAILVSWLFVTAAIGPVLPIA